MSQDPRGWQAPAAGRDELLAPATQVVRDREDYLGQGGREIGRRIADDQVELFVTGDPALALQQQFERVGPDFIVLHDVGTSASLRLLGALAGAAGARVQRLSIRLQGHGVALAVIQFVEIPLGDGRKLGVYSTDINADMQARRSLAMVLLGRSRLGALLVGELPPHALTAALQPLHQALRSGNWPNRELLFVPLGTGTMLAAQANQLVGGSGVVARVTPQAIRPNDAWSYISGAWNRLETALDHPDAAVSTDVSRAIPAPPVPLPEAPTLPMDLTPAAAALPPQPMPMPSAGGTRWAEYAGHYTAVKGVLACCVFDLYNRRPLAHAGGRPSAERMATQGALLLTAASDATRALGLGSAPAEALVSAGEQHLLLRPVPGHPGIVVISVLQMRASNVPVVRNQLERIAPPE